MKWSGGGSSRSSSAILWRARARPASPSRSFWSRSMTIVPRASAKGDEIMRGRSMTRVSQVGMALFWIFVATGAGLAAITNQPAWFAPGLAAGLYLLFSIRVADQWERVAVLRFGKYRGLMGPGMFHVIPIVDSVTRYVDQRVRVASVSAESTLTRDTVPVNVDAIVFWMVWIAEKAILEVEDFVQAIM